MNTIIKSINIISWFFFMFCALVFLAACSTVPSVEYQNLAREYYNVGVSYLELKQYDQAKINFEKSYGLWPEMPAATLHIVRILGEQGQYDLALHMIRQLMLTEPDNSVIEEVYAWLLAKKGSLQDARSAYTRLLAKSGERLSVLVNLARLNAKEDPVLAHDLWKRVSMLSQDSQVYALEIGDSALAVKELELAYEQYLKYVSGTNKEPAALLLIAEFMEANKYYSDALLIWKQSLEQSKDKGVTWFKISRLQYITNDDVQSPQSLKSALDEKYNDWKALVSLYKEIPDDRRGEFLGIVKSFNADFAP